MEPEGSGGRAGAAVPPSIGRWLRQTVFALLVLAVSGGAYLAGYAVRHYLAPLSLSERQVALGVLADVNGERSASHMVGRAPVRITLTDHDQRRGPSDAPVTIVEYSDYECPFCRLFHEQTLDSLLERYPGQIQYVVRDFPLAIHPAAQRAAEAGRCAAEQDGYWPYHAALFAQMERWAAVETVDPVYTAMAEELGLDGRRLQNCLDAGRSAALVEWDLTQGISQGVRATPTFFVNGKMVVGAQPVETFAELIEESLAAAP